MTVYDDAAVYDWKKWLPYIEKMNTSYNSVYLSFQMIKEDIWRLKTNMIRSYGAPCPIYGCDHEYCKTIRQLP